MARIVRKVSNKATKGQKREKGKLIRSKKFWIIVISVLVVLIAAGITIGVIVANNNKSDETVEVDDYFGQTQTQSDTDVKFTKMTYQGVKLHTNAEEGELFNDFTFVFAASLASFYPMDLEDADGNNLKNSKHVAIFKGLVELQYEIDKYNSSADPEYKLALYIVNTDVVDGNTSNAIYADSALGGASDGELTGPLFSVITEDGVVQKINGKVAIATDYYSENAMVSAIEAARNLVKNKDFDKVSYES